MCIVALMDAHLHNVHFIDSIKIGINFTVLMDISV